ncbi:hypothetical protein [Salinilacihabitans rarus]|uniref:hypothetical protein n=1 Tax=Salinilacihabitans rarus TaxID=2961596 RepID=UPI0020C8E6A8|nr:hypothetical protein [Salinilacihabitans rarus]
MPTVDYYDRILWGIPACVLLGAALGLATSISFEAGLAAGSLAATAFVYEAIYRNPPIPTTPRRAKVAVVVWHVIVVTLVAAAVY